MELSEGAPFLLDAASTPREKLAESGPGVLTDIDIVALLIGSGQRGRNVRAIAESLAHILADAQTLPSFGELTSVPGVGSAIAARLCAAFELGRRVFVPRATKIRTPGDAFAVVRHIGDRKQEHFLVLTLNGAHELLRSVLVSIGLVNRTVIHPREVFAPALEDRAAAVLVAHNHPSGNVDPSGDDEDVTQRLSESGEILGIPVLDHIVFSSRRFTSFLESGRI